MQRSPITFTKAPRVLAVVAITLMVAGAAIAQDDVDLFPIECKDLFENLYVLNDNVRANLEILGGPVPDSRRRHRDRSLLQHPCDPAGGSGATGRHRASSQLSVRGLQGV